MLKPSIYKKDETERDRQAQKFSYHDQVMFSVGWNKCRDYLRKTYSADKEAFAEEMGRRRGFDEGWAACADSHTVPRIEEVGRLKEALELITSPHRNKETCVEIAKKALKGIK